MKTLPLIVSLILATAAFAPSMRAEDAPQDKPAKTDCSCCSTDKDGQKVCTCKDCCAGKSGPAEKVIPKSSYNRKS